MSPAKINDLFDILRAACARQFTFNPQQVTARMRYVGTEGHGKDIVHVFRDMGSHSQIELKSTYATLRETHGDKPHWADAEKALYMKSDAEIAAVAAAHQAELEFTRDCALYQDHREQLLSHYKAWPAYQAGRLKPRDAARELVETLAKADDPRLAAYAAQMGSNDLEHLSHLLLAPCHFEIEALAKA